MKKILGFALAFILFSMSCWAATRQIYAVTVGVTSAQALIAAIGPRSYLLIDNESTTATIACNFGGTAALNTAGDYTIGPGLTREWVSPDPNRFPLSGAALNCIASGASTPVTIEVIQ